MNDGIGGRITEDAFDSFIDAKKKLRPQTASLMVIPNDRISKLPPQLPDETEPPQLKLHKFGLDFFPGPA